jgi:ubiquinone/menaquinone biosynthesis C-methylase UbiE
LATDRPIPRLLLVTALVIGGGCGSTDGAAIDQPEPVPDPQPSGHLLFDQVSHSYPHHDEYELEHQLIIRSEDPELVMELLALQEGMVAGDIGCGSGFYTFRFARAVGASGTVHAIDIQQAALDHLRPRLTDREINPHDNVLLALTAVDDCSLPAETLDAALLSHADFYAYPTLLPENERLLVSLHRALKADGVLVIVQDLSVSDQFEATTIEAHLTDAGFSLQRSVQPEGDHDVYMRFVKFTPPGTEVGG